MYHKEEIIDGILCYKSSPNDDWHPYTLEALTDKIVSCRKERDAIAEELENIKTKPRYNL